MLRASGPNLAIEPLTPDRFADLATLFEQGGDPKWCWCTFYRQRNLTWANASADKNRAMLQGLASAADEQGRHPPGLVGYQDDRVVGWISLGPRAEYDRLVHARVLAPVDDRPVWSIVCFVVDRRHRRRGIAVAMLEGAIDHARRWGATTLEAYPLDTAGGRLPSAAVYHGTLSMFERAGFAVVAERRASAGSRPRPIVRLDL